MSHIRNQIAGTLRARLAADLTGALDLSAFPFAVGSSRLPAYAVRIVPGSAELAGMGARGHYVTADRATVYAWAEGDQSTEAALWAFADEVFEIVTRGDGSLDGLVERITPGGAEVAVYPGERRIWGLEVGLDLLYLETPAPAIDAADYSAGYSLGFRS
jgi:hypothetical protein